MQCDNNMEWNDSKFVRLSTGPNDDLKMLGLFTPEYNDMIGQEGVTRDLGIQVDQDYNFKTHRLLTAQKVTKQCGWILRTFATRDASVLKLLWKSLIQPLQDYGTQLWAPWKDKSALLIQETPLRNYTRRFSNMSQFNYWQRLSILKMFSTQRRVDRYRVLYIKKSLLGLVPSLGLTLINNKRRGIIINIPNYICKVQHITTLKENSIKIAGSKIYNELPRFLREHDRSFQNFKELFDIFLENIPDCPILPGYNSHNLDKNSSQSNELSDWMKNMNLEDWTPQDLDIKS